MHPHPHNTTEAIEARNWQIVTDAFGYDSIHETTEDGRPGDLIAHSFGDHSALLRAAPELRDALLALANDFKMVADSGDCGNYDPAECEVYVNARAALASAS